MKTGRKPLPAPVHMEGGADPARLSLASERLNELAALDNEAELRTLELARKLGYDGPLDPDVIERGVVYQMRRTVEACLETGRMLLVLKERVGHGNLLQRLEKLGIEYRGAAKFMQAALKFANVPTSAHLTDAIGSPSKLIELLVLDQEEIKELATEGSVLGIRTDEIAAMPVHELRAKLRDARQTLSAKDKVIAKRDEKIAQLQEEAEPPSEATTLQRLNAAGAGAQVAMLQLVKLAGEVMDEHEGRGLDQHARACIEYVSGLIANFAVTHDITIDLNQLAGAPWVLQGAAE